MIAVDTNVVVRLLTGDEPAETERARRLFESEMIFLPKTVILETEWVLRRLYRLGALPLNRALEGLIGLANVRCEDEPAVRQALIWKQQGMDFADALHLASGRSVTRFATFDLRMIRVAAAAGRMVSEP